MERDQGNKTLLNVPVFDQVDQKLALLVMSPGGIASGPVHIDEGEYHGQDMFLIDWRKLEPHFQTLCEKYGLECDFNKTFTVCGVAMPLEYALYYYSKQTEDTRLYFAAEFIEHLRACYLILTGQCDGDIVSSLLKYGDAKTSLVAALSQRIFMAGLTRKRDSAKGGNTSRYDDWYESVIEPTILSHIKAKHRTKETEEQLTERLMNRLIVEDCQYAYALSKSTVRAWIKNLEQGLVVF